MIPSAILLPSSLHIRLTGTSVSRNVHGTANAIYAANSTGTVFTNGALFENWISKPSFAGNYDVMATLTSGPAPSGTLNSWLPLTSSRSWTLTNSGLDDSTISCTLLIQIRERSTGNVKATATVNLSATSRSTA